MAREHGPRPLYRITTLQIIRIVVAILVPPVTVLAAIHSRALGILAVKRPGLLALVMLTIAFALFFQRSRRLLVIVLGYSAAVLASASLVRVRISGPPADLGRLVNFYSVAWLLVLILGLTAGTLELLRPSSVLAKRLLFAAGTVLLIGYGTVGMATFPNALSLAAIVAGVASAVAAVLAHRLTLPMNWEAPLDPESAEALARQRRERLRAREWRDPAANR